MKKIITVFILFAVASFTIAPFAVVPVFAKNKKIKVNFTMDELAFSINAIDSIEILGEETAPYLDIKNMLLRVYKKASSAEKDNVDIVFIIPQARNFLILLQRAKFRGAEAFLFNDISGKIVRALK